MVDFYWYDFHVGKYCSPMGHESNIELLLFCITSIRCNGKKSQINPIDISQTAFPKKHEGLKIMASQPTPM